MYILVGLNYILDHLDTSNERVTSKHLVPLVVKGPVSVGALRFTALRSTWGGKRETLASKVS